jgi:hypothetical protein
MVRCQVTKQSIIITYVLNVGASKDIQSFSVPVQILLNITKGFQRSEKKKEVKFDLFSELAPLDAKSCNWMRLY